MKRVFILITLVFLAVLLQVSVFSGWSVSLLGAPAAPQIFAVLAVFLLFELPESYLWWFSFIYYLFYDLITRPSHPGLNLLLAMGALLALKLLKSRFLKSSHASSALIFIAFGAFYFVLNHGQFRPPAVISQTLANLFLFILFYPLLFYVCAHLKNNSSPQLNLKL